MTTDEVNARTLPEVSRLPWKPHRRVKHPAGTRHPKGWCVPTAAGPCAIEVTWPFDPKLPLDRLTLCGLAVAGDVELTFGRPACPTCRTKLLARRNALAASNLRLAYWFLANNKTPGILRHYDDACRIAERIIVDAASGYKYTARFSSMAMKCLRNELFYAVGDLAFMPEPRSTRTHERQRSAPEDLPILSLDGLRRQRKLHDVIDPATRPTKAILETPEAIWLLLDRLTVRQRSILNYRYREGYTLAEVAFLFRVTRQRIQQIEAAALDELYDLLATG